MIAALAQGGRVTVRNPDGFTPLLIAAQNGHTDICGLLVAHSSNVHDQNDEGFTPLLVAADNGHTDIIGLLLVYEGINASQNVYEGLNAQNCYEGINAFEKCV